MRRFNGPVRSADRVVLLSEVYDRETLREYLHRKEPHVSHGRRMRVRRLSVLVVPAVLVLAACSSPVEPEPQATISGYFAAVERSDVHLFLYDDVDGAQAESFFIERQSGDTRLLSWGTYVENGSALTFASAAAFPDTPHLTNATWKARPTSIRATVAAGLGTLTFNRSADDPPGGRALIPNFSQWP